MGVSLAVVIINTLLVYLIRFLSSLEKHPTYTAYNLSVGLKLVLAMFANSALISPVVHAISWDRWFNNSNSFTTDIFYNSLSVAFVTPVLALIDFNH